MNSVRKTLLYLLIGSILLISNKLTAQSQLQLSEKSQISVLTCGPGNVLYTTFGHSAIRVYDPEIRLDRVYNYGTFDFNAPNFYLNFAKGKLTYMLSVSRTNHFLSYYNYENRWVKAQLLDLDLNDKQTVFNYLENNAKPQNRSYQYDFFYDNCSTKIEAVLLEALGDKVVFNNDHIKTEKSHRDLIADYTGNNNWGKFGIDLALGSVIDDTATPQEYKFLPDYMFEGIETASLNGESLTKNTVDILKTNTNIKVEETVFSPYLVLSLFALIVIFFTYRGSIKNKRYKIIDVLLFLITGVIGIVVLLLWFATDHTATYENYNFLWAFPFNFIVAFYMMKNDLPACLPKYLMFLNSAILGTIVLWISGHQIFNPGIIPLLVALTVRYYYLNRVLKRNIAPAN